MNDTSRLAAALADRYRIERELGGGGMSRVFLAEELALGRTVVIKVIAPELLEGLSAERFAREVKLAARLQQANIVPVLTAGSADGLPYYTMPFVRGESLRARMASGERVPVPVAVSILRDMARALAYAHGEGIVHRDIKPENILLSGGAAVVTDFGIAKAISASRTVAGGDTLTQLGTSIGTPAYMAPEQAAGDPGTDHRADIYAWGVVAWELLAGKHPFTGRTTPQSLLAAHMGETPAPLTTSRPDITPALAEVIRRTLEKDPARRPGSAAELIAVLDGGGLPAPGRPRTLIRAGLGALVVVLVIGAWLATRHPAASPSVANAPKSIAVLPLVNVGGDSTQEYFADGIAEELTNALGKVPGLRVAARTSSYAFKGRRDLDVREVGQKLGVGVVLQGSVRRTGDRLKVSVQLIDAEQQVELWSESYDRTIKDVFAVQDSITQAVVSRLALELRGAELAATVAGRTGNPEAHDRYLQGLALAHEATEPALRRALDYFRQALVKDPGYAQAYVGIAWAYAFLADAYQVPAIAYDSARIAAREAMKLGSQAGENIVVLAYAMYGVEWDPANAGREMQRGARMSPNSSDVAAIYANWMCLNGQIDAGLAEADRAIELDRLAPLAGFVREWCLYLGRRYDAVIAQHAKALDQTFLYLDTFLGAALREQGRYEEALTEYRRAQGYMGDLPLHGYAITYARMGKTKEAREILGRLEAYARSHYVNPLFFAAIYANLGEEDLAFTWLDRAVSDRTVLIAGLNAWPELDPLRSDPRFAVLARRVGLPSR